MMDSVKCDTLTRATRGVTEEGVSPAQTEWGGGRGGRGHKVGEQLRNPRHRVWQWP